MGSFSDAISMLTSCSRCFFSNVLKEL
jgi:hypothetical protein